MKKQGRRSENDHSLFTERNGKKSEIKFHLDTFRHFIAIRRGQKKDLYEYDVYWNDSEHPDYIGRVKVNQNGTISESTKRNACSTT